MISILLLLGFGEL